MHIEAVFDELGVHPKPGDDLHICRMMHAFVAVSHGQVVGVTPPRLEYCPLVSLLYDNPGGAAGRDELEQMIREMTAEKIRRFGHFTDRRELSRSDIAVPFGASEMMMAAMERGVIDATVTVCDGAGTVVAARPDLVQGIGARMNGLFYTSPIAATIARLRAHGAIVPFADTAAIDQAGGARAAAEQGFRSLAVTVNGCLGESLGRLRQVERDLGVEITCIVVCTTGASAQRVDEMGRHADLVWSCASGGVREVVGAGSIIQVSTAIPVFAVTPRGVKFLSAYCDTPERFEALDLSKQYLIAGNSGGEPLVMGRMKTAMAECALPVRSAKEPRPLA